MKNDLWPDGKAGYTKTWWVTFTDGRGACYEGEPDDVEARAGADGTPRTIRPLPYPASPRVGPESDCPSFCTDPRRCQGRTSCPQSYACSE